MKKTLAFLLITSWIFPVSALAVQAQQATEMKQNPSEKKPEDEVAKKLRENTVEFVRSIGRDSNGLNLPENRVSFSMEAANMLWEADEKAAREMFQTAMNDVRTLVIEAEKVKQAEETAEDEVTEDFAVAETLGRGRKASSIMRLREQLVMTLAKYDAKTAYDFLLETRSAETPKKENRTYYYEPPNNEARLEMRLAEIVAQQDTSRALEIALKSVEKSVGNYQLPTLLAKLYAKDAEKGAKLAAEILKKLRSEKLVEEYMARSVAFELLEQGAKSLEKGKSKTGSTTPKVPLLSESEMRELAEILVKVGLDAQFNEETRYGIFANIGNQIPLLQKYAPSSTAQLKLKIAQNNKSSNAANTARAASNMATTVAVSAANMATNANVSTTAVEKAKKAEEAAKAENEEFERLGKSASSPESKVSADEYRASLNKIKSRNARILAYSQLAYQLAQSGNKKAAKELLTDAERLTVPQARKSTEMLEHLMLIRAYSAVEPERAFQMLEAIVFEMNDVVAGFAKVASFIVEEAIIENGEIDLTGFASEMLGRSGISAQLFGGLNEALINMAKSDFDRTAALADKFSRSEIRLTAKMIIARSLMPEKNSENDLEPEEARPTAEDAEVKTAAPASIPPSKK